MVSKVEAESVISMGQFRQTGFAKKRLCSCTPNRAMLLALCVRGVGMDVKVGIFCFGCFS